MAHLVSLDKYLVQHPVPAWDHDKTSDENFAAETAWLVALGEAIRQDNGGSGAASGIIGEVVRWPRADGYAEYIIVKTKPLQLAHIPLGDGYMVEPALIRGTTLAEVKRMVEDERRWSKLFAGKGVVQVTIDKNGEFVEAK